MRKICAISLFATLALGSYAQNLLRNPGFESVSTTLVGQALLPNDWFAFSGSPDTYSNDGSYGLSPSDFGNFPGVTAQEGERWVAGWSLAIESIGQSLSAPLTNGKTYYVSAWLRQAIRGDLGHTGGYDVLLATTGQQSIVVAHLGDTTTDTRWRFFASSFTVPVDGNTYSYIVFQPDSLQQPTTSCYPGIDNVSLTEAPTATLSGTVDLQTFLGDPEGFVGTVEFRNPGSPVPVFSYPIALDSTGAYQAGNVAAGSWDVSLKIAHWLRQTIGSQTLASGVNSVDFSLANGDAFDDNMVDLFDLNTIFLGFGTNDPTLDLDGSGFVDLFDLNIVLTNFGTAGDQ